MALLVRTLLYCYVRSPNVTQAAGLGETLPDGCAVDTVDIARIARLVDAMPDELDKLFSSQELVDAGEGAGRIAS